MPNSSSCNEHSTDEQLMLAFSRGDRASFERLFERYRQPIYAFYRRRVRDQSRAEELTQEAFMALLRSANRYQPQAPFRTYLFAVAFRILAVERRKAAIRSFFFLPSNSIEVSRTPAIEQVLWLRQALWGLKRTDREILMLREFEQLSYAEIAEVLRQPVNTVRSRLFRARAALRERLGGRPATKGNALAEKGGET